MSSAKNLLTWGALAKIETTYGTDAAPVAADDGLLLAEAPEVALSYIYDGSRGYSPSGTKSPGAPSKGREASFTAMAEAIGAGSAYSATNLPSIDVLLRIAGFKAAVVTTGGSESVTYTPATAIADMDSATFEIYRRGQKYDIFGAYAETLSMSVDGPAVPMWEFPIKGIGALPSDASVPSISSYPSVSLLPPVAVDVSLSVNSVTDLVLRGFTLEMNRELDARPDDNSTSGHAGFAPGRRSPTLELVVESEALTSLNPYSLRENGTLIAVSFTVGSTQYNRWSFSSSTCRITDVGEDADGNAAIWTLSMELVPSTYGGEDDLTIVFD